MWSRLPSVGKKVVVVVALVGVGFALGRFTRAPAVDVSKTQERSTTTENVATREDESRAAERTGSRVVDETRTTFPDGRIEEHRTIRSDRTSRETAVRVETRVEERVVYRDRVTERRIELKAAYRATLRVEAAPFAWRGTPDVQLGGGIRLGRTPVWLEAAAGTSPTAPLQGLRAGIGLAVEF